MAKQIDLLFGVKGGASVSGESGALIKSQIDGIVKELNDSKIASLQLNIDQGALKKQITEIKSLLKEVDFAKLGSSSSQDKKLTVKAAGNIHNLRKAYGDLAMSMAKVNKARFDMESLDYTPQLETLKIAISEFDKAWSNVSYRSGNVLPYSAKEITAENLLKVAEAAKAVQAAMMEATTASKANGNEVKAAFKEEANEAKKAAADIKKAIGDTKNAYGNLGSIQASFNKKILNFDSIDDSTQKTAAQAEIENLKKLFDELSDGNGGFKALNLEDERMVGVVNQISEAWKRVKIAIEEATTASKLNGEKVKKVADISKKLGANGLGFLTGEKNNQFDIEKYNDIVVQFNKVGKGLIFSGNNKQYVAMSDAINNASDLIQTMKGKDGILPKLDPKHVKEYGELAEYLKIIQQNAGRIKSSGDDLGMEKVIDKLHTFGQSLKNLENYPQLMSQYKELEASLENGTVTTIEEANKKLLDFKNACADAGVQVNSLADDILNGIANQLQYLVRMFVATAITSKLREIYTNVVAIDSAMTELKKVTDATEQKYIQFMDNATERANKLGASVREVVNASADYARLGYSIDEASKLADSAIIYKNVGDGLEGIDQATEHLISTMKAFGIEAEGSMRIVDVFNEVANHFPTSAAGIGEGMQRSAAALASAGNSLEESVAIFTAAQSIAQDADVVGIYKCADFKDNYIG